MKQLFKEYESLTAGQRKLLCFLAFTGLSTSKSVLSVYAKKEDVSYKSVRTTVSTLWRFLTPTLYSFREEYELQERHRLPLLLFMICENRQWLDHFEKFFRQQQDPESVTMIQDLQKCIDGKTDITTKGISSDRLQDMLVPLATYPCFLPLIHAIRAGDVFDFMTKALSYQLDYDMADPQQNMSRIAERIFSLVSDEQRKTLQSLVALSSFFNSGHYDAACASYNNIYAHLLSGTNALYHGEYETAFKQFSKAIREHNKDVAPFKKGYFSTAMINYLLVMAYYLHKPDCGTKLNALKKKDGFARQSEYEAVRLLAVYLSDGEAPTKYHIKNSLSKTTGPASQYMAFLIVRFFGLENASPTTDLPSPNLFIFRQELSAYLPANTQDQAPNAHDYSPLISRLQFKQEWELVLEELTLGEDDKRQMKEKRVCYLINNDSITIKEQSRLKTGEWGAGKQMSYETFRKGTPFMDDTDRKIAASLTGWYTYEIEMQKALPLLVGSNRTYVGRYPPYAPVTIVEEKPYLIIERTATAFTIKSNIGNAKWKNECVYRKDSDTHYTVIKISDIQRTYYQKLLGVGAFPLSAEQKLREFIPKICDTVEVHSDLVEGGSTLPQRDGSSQLCIQVLPAPGLRNLFNATCLARPLADGATLLQPAQGLNPCVAEANGARYQVKRDIKGERNNLELLRTFIEDNDLNANNSVTDFSSAITMSAESLLMLMEFIQQHTEQFYMEWPEGGNINLKFSQPGQWNIALKSKSGWFEVEGDIPVDEDTVLSVSQLLQLIAESPMKGFIRLNDTDFLAISEKLRRQLSRIESLAVRNRDHLQISEFHASLLGNALNGEVSIKHDKHLDQLQEKIKKSMAQRPRDPMQLKAELRDYQHEGFAWMVRMTGWGAGVCLADDMGLGKTVQAIAFMLYTAAKGPTLVAAPASVVPNWKHELQRFAPTLSVEVLNTVPDRSTVIKKAGKYDVLLTSYGLFVTESEALLSKQWQTVCLDEAHVIKNRETKTSASAMKLQAKNRIILTGTPLQNHLGELWNLFQFINPGLLGSHEQFMSKYIIPIEQNANKERSRQLKRIVAPFMLRRTKQEVMEELPEKTEINMPIELSDDEMAIYEVIRRRAKKMLEEEASGAVSVNTLAEITRLRQAACAAQLAEKGWTGECSKINTLVDIVSNIVEGGNNVLVFSQFTSFLALVRETFDKMNISYAYLDGSTPIKKRERLVSEFQHGQHSVFIISLKAGGLGLNLTAANYVIHLDPWWNPAIEQQATDRAHRIGQQQKVTVYHLIAQHTIEEKILRLHATKKNLADAMLQGTSQSHKLTASDLLKMISG